MRGPLPSDYSTVRRTLRSLVRLRPGLLRCNLPRLPLSHVDQLVRRPIWLRFFHRHFTPLPPIIPQRLLYAILTPLPLFRAPLRYSMRNLPPKGDAYIISHLQPDSLRLQGPSSISTESISPSFPFRYSSTFFRESLIRGLRFRIVMVRAREMSDQCIEATQRVADFAR